MKGGLYCLGRSFLVLRKGGTMGGTEQRIECVYEEN